VPGPQGFWVYSRLILLDLGTPEVHAEWFGVTASTFEVSLEQS
jgi:hypothetical protein